MSQVDQQVHSVEASEDELPQSESASSHSGGRKQNSLATQKAARAEQDVDDDLPTRPRARTGRRIVPVHESRIKDRPAKVGEKDSSLKIKIELDLEVEVEIYARVKGDVTIGLL